MPETPPPVYNGRYELSRQIARGGTAQVYLAHDLLLDRPVALKMLFPELSSDHSFVERFRREEMCIRDRRFSGRWWQAPAARGGARSGAQVGWR